MSLFFRGIAFRRGCTTKNAVQSSKSYETSSTIRTKSDWRLEKSQFEFFVLKILEKSGRSSGKISLGKSNQSRSPRRCRSKENQEEVDERQEKRIIKNNGRLISFTLSTLGLGGLDLGKISFVVTTDVVIDFTTNSDANHAEDEIEPVNVEALKCSQKRQPEARNADLEQRSGVARAHTSALRDVVVLARGVVVQNGPKNTIRQDDEARDEEDAGEQTKGVVGDTFETSITAELGTLQEDVGNVMKNENDATNAMLTEHVRNTEQSDCNEMMSQHNELIGVVLARMAEKEDDNAGANVEGSLSRVNQLKTNAAA